MHELVKRGVKISMEQDGKDSSTQHEKSAIDAMAALFSFLVKNAIISDYQVAKGVSRLHKILDFVYLFVWGKPFVFSHIANPVVHGLLHIAGNVVRGGKTGTESDAIPRLLVALSNRGARGCLPWINLALRK